VLDQDDVWTRGVGDQVKGVAVVHEKQALEPPLELVAALPISFRESEFGGIDLFY
jgi:hypothetical protein